jgi:hypothetical protein
MDQYINEEGYVELPGVEWLALIFFIAAWLVNRRLEGNNWSPWIVLPTAIIGSLMWYASSWSAKTSNGVEDLIGLFGAPVTTVMSIICVVALIGTVADLLIDTSYNIAAVWALIIAPVAAHGAGGFVGEFVRGFYGGVTLAVWQMIGDVFGA